MEARKSPNKFLTIIVKEFKNLSVTETGLCANNTLKICTINFRKIPSPSFISELIQYY